jgi:hypothetical protein
MYSWSIRYQFDPRDSEAPMCEDNLTEIDVLRMLCLSLRPGLQHNRPCTMTIDQGQKTRLVVHLIPTDRKTKAAAPYKRKFSSRKKGGR